MSALKPILKKVTNSVLSSILSESQRYFTTLIASGSMRYAFAATLVSGTAITLTVYPTNGTQGLPPGAPAVTDNKWQTITYTTTGNVDDLGFDGVNFFGGIIWDYSAPSVNVALALKENFALTSTAKNSLDPSGATDATAINISESDLFTLQSNGDYLGVERVVNGGFDTGSDWILPTGGSISNGELVYTSVGSTLRATQTPNPLSADAIYLTEFTINSIPSGALAMGDGDIQRNAPGTYTNNQTGTGGANLSGPIARGTTTATIDNVSIKQLLELA